MKAFIELLRFVWQYLTEPYVKNECSRCACPLTDNAIERRVCFDCSQIYGW